MLRRDSAEQTWFQCHVCGEFGMTFELIVDREMRGQPHPYLSAATRKAHESGGQLLLNTKNWQELEESQRSIRYSEKLHHLLRFIADKSRSPGHEWKTKPPFDYPLIAAEDSSEFEAYLDHLVQQGMLKPCRDIVDGRAYQLTIPAWQAV